MHPQCSQSHSVPASLWLGEGVAHHIPWYCREKKKYNSNHRQFHAHHLSMFSVDCLHDTVVYKYFTFNKLASNTGNLGSNTHREANYCVYYMWKMLPKPYFTLYCPSGIHKVSLICFFVKSKFTCLDSCFGKVLTYLELLPHSRKVHWVSTHESCELSLQHSTILRW